MKKLLGCAALAAMIAGPAMAADMPAKAKAPPPPPPVYDWSGAYVGFSIGGVWYDVDRYYPNFGLLQPALPATTYTSSGDDVIYDFHAGWQYQWGPVILGIEAGYSGGFKEMRSTVVLPNPPFADNAALGLTAEHKITNLFTVGPRLGFAWDRFMIYGTGGYATATIKAQYLSTATGLVFNNGAQAGATWNDGWFAGGGIEYMVYKGPLVDVVFGAEYQHFDVSSKHAFCFVGNCATANYRDYDLSATGDIVRARLTIKTQAWGFFGK
jgi:outer membrane immunogenic protein